MSSKLIAIYRFRPILFSSCPNLEFKDNDCFSDIDIISADTMQLDIDLKWLDEKRIPNIIFNGQREEDIIFFQEKKASIRIYWEEGLMFCFGLGNKSAKLIAVLNQCLKEEIQVINKSFSIQNLIANYLQVPNLLHQIQKIKVLNLAIETIPCVTVEINECAFDELASFMSNTEATISRITLFFSHNDFSSIRMTNKGRVYLHYSHEWDWESSISFLKTFIATSKMLKG